MDSGGFLKLFRKSINSEIWFKGPVYWQLWCFCLLTAKFKDEGMFKRGQFWINWRKQRAATPFASMHQIYAFLKWAKTHNMIVTKQTNGGTLITICNYDKYRYKETITNESQTNRRLIADESQTNEHRSIIYKKKEERRKKNTNTVKKVTGVNTWFSYAEAYADRYKVQPARNAKTNSLCLRLVNYVGEEKAIKIVSAYLSLNDQWYLKKGHSLDSCLQDYQKILTYAESGVRITTTRARQMDETQTAFDAVDMAFNNYEKITGKEFGE